MSPTQFEPAIPATDRLQALDLDRSATGMGSINLHGVLIKKKIFNLNYLSSIVKHVST
jgi:hypothetical protein